MKIKKAWYSVNPVATSTYSKYVELKKFKWLF